MSRTIKDPLGMVWTASEVGPIGLGRSRPTLWDLVFKPESGDKVSEPITPGTLATMTDSELLGLLRKLRRRDYVTVGGPVLPDHHIEESMSVGTCDDPEHIGLRSQVLGRRLIPYRGHTYFACADCLRHLANEGALPAWAARMLRKAS